MGTELLIEAEMVPFLKQVDVVLGKKTDAVDYAAPFFNACIFHAEPLRSLVPEE
jgi:hypothetical protein